MAGRSSLLCPAGLWPMLWSRVDLFAVDLRWLMNDATPMVELLLLAEGMTDQDRMVSAAVLWSVIETHGFCPRTLTHIHGGSPLFNLLIITDPYGTSVSGEACRAVHTNPRHGAPQKLGNLETIVTAPLHQHAREPAGHLATTC